MYEEVNSNSNLFFEDVYFYFISKLCVVLCIKRQSYLKYIETAFFLLE